MNADSLRCVGLLLGASFGCATLARAAPANLIGNPSFEAGAGSPGGWQLFAPAGAVLTRDEGVARAGRASAAMAIDAEGAREYPCFRFRLAGVAPGEEYLGTTWAKTAGMAGLGAYVVIEFYQGQKRLSFAQGSFTGAGDHDWMELACRAMVPEGTDAIAFGLVAHGEGRAWFDDASLARVGDAPPPFTGDEVRLAVETRRVLCPRFLGFGAQGDYFLTRDINTSHGVTEADRKLVLDRVAAMRPAIIRTFFDYQWWEPEEGRPTPESEAMRDYVGWVRFLKAHGTAVLLCPWGDVFAYPAWMRDGNSRLPLPGDREAMLRSLADLVVYLRRDQGLNNVRYLCLMNEPDNDPTRPVPPDEFVRLYRLLDRMLRERGIRKEVALLAADESSGGPSEVSPWFRGVASRGLDYCDGVSVHTYKHEWVPNLVPWLRGRFDLLKEEARGHPPRPLLVTEFGYGGETFKNWENGKYEYGLFLADFAVTALRQGASAALMWCLFDTYYTPDRKQEYGLWRYKDEGWQPRPGFYSWSLLTRFCRPGSRVVRVSVRPEAFGVRSASLLSPEGRLTLLVVNRYPRTIRADLGVRGRRLRAYVYDRVVVGAAAGRMIEAKPGVAAAALELPPESFTLLTDME